MQKANGRFYPDIIAQTNDDRILIVEFKGAGFCNNAADDRKIGELWAEMSQGKCLFIMVQKDTMAQIDALLK
ncbi:MAG TPA: hypothetical protein DCP71_00660 [Verrucomicrobiales bacterium]|nr:hypothetical protein [Verrucomicrobiales bacterium]